MVRCQVEWKTQIIVILYNDVFVTRKRLVMSTFTGTMVRLTINKHDPQSPVTQDATSILFSYVTIWLMTGEKVILARVSIHDRVVIE